jgi:hypothetical protein
MKNLTTTFLILFVAVFLFSSCSNDYNSAEESTNERTANISNSVREDAQKLVDLQCKVMNLIGDAKNGDATALMKSEEYNKEAEKVSRELKEKYPTKEDQETFAKAYEEALGECK